jgi:hypothetical protein
MKSMAESEMQLLRRFVPKLTRPQIRALTMLGGGSRIGSGSWTDGMIHDVCGDLEPYKRKLRGPGRPALSPGQLVDRITVTLPTDELDAFAAECWRRKLNRSAAFRQALALWFESGPTTGAPKNSAAK